MPIDLFEQIQPTPQQEPRDLFAENNNVPRGTLNPEQVAANREITNRNFPERAMQPEMSNAEGIARHVLASGAQYGKNLLNIPHNLYSKIPTVGEKLLPEDPYQVYGVEKNLADKLGVGTLDFLTSLATTRGLGSTAMKGLGVSEKTAPIAKNISEYLKKNPFKKDVIENVGAGALLGAIEAPEGEKVLGATLGGALGAGGAIGAHGIDKFITKPIAGMYAKSAIPGLIERASTFVKGLPEPEMGANALKSAYNQAYSTQSKGISDVISRAKSMDEIRSGLPNAPFKDKPYTSYISNFVKEKSKLEPAISAKYQQAINFAKEEAANLAPKSIEGVVALRQNLNGYLKKYLEKNNVKSADHETKEFIKGLKDQLGAVLDNNTPAFMKKEMANFKGDWEKWNRDYAFSQEFKKGVGKAGNVKPKQVLREAMERGATPDPAVIGEFMPKPGQTSIAGFEQLEKLLGNKEAARNAIQSYSLRYLKQSGAGTKDIADIYSKYSPAQRKYLFGSTKEEPLLESANKAMLEFGRPSQAHGALGIAGHHALGFGVPGLIGTGAGMAAGLPWEEALAIGGLPAALGYKGLKHLIGKKATPKSIEKALKLYEQGTKKNISPSLLNAGLQGGLGLGGNQ